VNYAGPTDDVTLLRTKCAQNKLKLTPQRIAIYEALRGAMDHPSADRIYRRIKKKYPSLSLDTVNRTLLTFARIGLTKTVEGYGEPKRFDSNMRPHHHFRCLGCGCIDDIHSKSFDNVAVSSKLKKQYAVQEKKVVLEGFCKKCQGKNKKICQTIRSKT